MLCCANIVKCIRAIDKSQTSSHEKKKIYIYIKKLKKIFLHNKKIIPDCAIT